MRANAVRCGVLLILCLVGLPACQVTSLPLWKPAESVVPAADVEHVRDVAYHDGPGTDGFRHRLDLYLPKGKRSFPVVVLVHGGAWMVGDNRCCGLYSAVGDFLASEGIGAVLPNYRLSPRVKHPGHVQDVARAIAWTRANIADYGGDPNNLFLAGHSAGGHLVSLLCTDDTYLLALGMKTSDIRGVISVSGVYRIPEGKMDVTLNGLSESGFRLEQISPFRGESRRTTVSRGIEVPLKIDIFGPVFGDNARQRAEASPLTHVRPGLPPFLICYAEKDLPSLPAMATEFHDALVKVGCSSQLHEVKNRNHNSIMFQAIDRHDPVAEKIARFVRQHAMPVRPASR